MGRAVGVQFSATGDYKNRRGNGKVKLPVPVTFPLRPEGVATSIWYKDHVLIEEEKP